MAYTQYLFFSLFGCVLDSLYMGLAGISATLLGGVRRVAQALPDPRSAGSRRMAGPGMRGPTYWLVRGSPPLGRSSITSLKNSIDFGP